MDFILEKSIGDTIWLRRRTALEDSLKGHGGRTEQRMSGRHATLGFLFGSNLVRRAQSFGGGCCAATSNGAGGGGDPLVVRGGKEGRWDRRT